MANLDRNRAEKLMLEIGVEALILLSPESFVYATGVNAGVATMWRRSGAVAVLIPRDHRIAETAIVSDLFLENFRAYSHIKDLRESPIWVETANLTMEDKSKSAKEQISSFVAGQSRPEEFNRPTTFEPKICYQHLRDVIFEHGLADSRIGYEASAISVSEYPEIRTIFKKIELVEADNMINQLKMVKNKREIEHLRLASEIAESGMIAIRDAIEEGISRDELEIIWKEAIYSHSKSAALNGSWEYISVGDNPWGGNARVKEGDLIKVDVGCLVDGYSSDGARTFIFGEPSNTKLEIYDALLSGFQAGCSQLHPGKQLKDIYWATLSAIRARGFSSYTRGHFGHGLGNGLGSEQWPFISADTETRLEPGMVMAFECPWYIDGLGGMIIENQFLVCDTGCEMMNSLPIQLQSIKK